MSTAVSIRRITFITEANLYRLIAQSCKPEAQAFVNWIFDKVLPTLLKTGRFEMEPQLINRKCFASGTLHPYR